MEGVVISKDGTHKFRDDDSITRVDAVKTEEGVDIFKVNGVI